MLFARLLQAFLHEGALHVIDADGKQWRFGDGGPEVTIRLHDRALHARLAVNPQLRVGEAYMDGTLTIEEGTLYDFIDLCVRNLHYLESTRLQRMGHAISMAMRPLQQYNPKWRARKNVAHHYDLSDSLYDLFLDADRQYSCGYFPAGDESLEAAQEAKKRHIAAKLLLDRPGLTVLDIGSGWGGLALYLADQGAARVRGVTLSVEQHKVSERRAGEAGARDRVSFALSDYRAERAQYDRIVSVGMFEHVGARHYEEFFGKLRGLMKEDGVALLHSIGRMEPPGTTSPWLRKYIFPGGYTPALSEVLRAVERSGLWVTDIEILRLHYAETIRRWRERFMARRDEAVALYDERFCRMWEFYLVATEVAFRRMGQMVFQMQLTRRQDAVPMTRDYMVDCERRLVDSAQMTANGRRRGVAA